MFPLLERKTMNTESFAVSGIDDALVNGHPIGSVIVHAGCEYEDGKFVLESLPSVLPSRCTVRFTAPADFAQDAAVVANGLEMPLCLPESGSGRIFSSGQVVECDIDLDRKAASIIISNGNSIMESKLKMSKIIDMPPQEMCWGGANEARSTNSKGQVISSRTAIFGWPQLYRYAAGSWAEISVTLDKPNMRLYSTPTATMLSDTGTENATRFLTVSTGSDKCRIKFVSPKPVLQVSLYSIFYWTQS